MTFALLLATAMMTSPTNIPATRVAIYVDEGARNTGVYRLLEMGARAPELDPIPVDAAMIREGALARADVLVMPGGSSTLQSRTLGEEGRKAIRDFVAGGGGYLGFCAGCFLAIESSPSHPDMLHLAPFTSDGPRGTAMLTLRFNARAEAIAGIKKGRRELRYADGPVMGLSLPVKDAEFEILATYDSDINPNGEPPRKSFAGQAAIIAGTYGKGRVFASAVHPEYTWSGRSVVKGAFKFLTGRDIDWKSPPRHRGQLAVGVVASKSFGVSFAEELIQQFRSHEFDLMPINREAVGAYTLNHVDVIVDGASGSAGEEEITSVDHIWNLKTYPDFASLKDFKPTIVQPSTSNLQPETKPIRVAAYAGKGGADYYICERMVCSPRFKVTVVDGADIAGGCLKDFDMVLMPGGSCKGECEGMGPQGCSNLVEFIKNGGKYYGVCAGAFLASQLNDPKFPRLEFVPYRDENEPVYRGGCNCRLKVTDAGRDVFRGSAENRMVCYNGGPVFVPGDPIEDTDVKVLMTYDCENISTKKPDPVMSIYGKGAMLGGRVGKGKVFVCGPHPEGSYYTDDIVDGGIEFLTDVRPNPTFRKRQPGQLVVRFKYTQNKSALDFYLNKLLPDARFDVRGGASGYGLASVDVCIVPKAKGDDLDSDMRAFAEQGGTVIVLVQSAEDEKMLETRPWAKAVRSYDEIISFLSTQTFDIYRKKR